MGASSSAPPHVAVITICYGSERVLPTLLESVTSAAETRPQILVVDNLPGGEVEAIAREAGARYVAQPDNPGYGGGANAAARLIDDTVEWLLIVNPDVVLGEGAIDELVRVGGSDPRIGSVGPAILSPGGELYPSARRIPSLRTGIGHALFGATWPGNPWSRQYRQDDQPTAREAGWLSGACLLVRRAAFEDIGGFDEGYFMYFEDVDLGMRLGRHGWRNRYEPTARVVHAGAHSTASRRDAMIRAHHLSANRFLAKKYPGVRWLPVRLALRAGLAARSALSVFRNRG